jgi:uncharacterized protein
MKIEIRQPKVEELEKQGVFNWPIWEKEVSRFDWYYDTEETCYLLEGRVKVTTPHGEAANLVPAIGCPFPCRCLNLLATARACIWEISVPVRKHFRMG